VSILELRTWQIGAKSLLLHPMRSALTVLGIFIGVASVIWLLAIGEGISIKAQEQIESLGASNIIVQSIEPPPDPNAGTFDIRPYGVTRADYRCLTNTIASIESALQIREIPRVFRRFRYEQEGRLVGCSPEYAEVVRLKTDRGRFLSDADLRNRENHCALSAEVAAKLFPYEDPIGHSIRVDEEYYVVVGVMKPKQATAAIGGSFAGQDFALDVYIPITTLWSRIGDQIITRRAGGIEGEIVELTQITLQVDKVENVLRTADLVQATLERNHRNEDFRMTIPLELLEQAKTTRLMFIIFMGLIAAISLLVGGIGIMNIMLATVTERTREIGVRRALGAKRTDIIRQFLVETIALSTVGGMLGVLGGLTCRPVSRLILVVLRGLVPRVMQQLPEVITSGEPVVVPWSIPLAFSIAVTISVIFGIYPAMRAAAMDPIEALRHE